MTGLAEENPAIPARSTRTLSLSPNPFSRGTNLQYFAAAPGRVELVARDAAGRELERHEFQAAKGPGRHYWQPEGLAPGVYFLSLKGAGTDATARVLLTD